MQGDKCMEKEIATKLRAALEALDARITTLEHLVNDTIIGGLRSAAEEYDDDVRYSEFVDNYKERYTPFEGVYKVLYGESNELPDVLYETIKEKSGEDGFDESAAVDEFIAEIQSKIDALEEMKDKAEEKKEEVEEDKEEISEEQLAKEFDNYVRR